MKFALVAALLMFLMTYQGEGYIDCGSEMAVNIKIRMPSCPNLNKWCKLKRKNIRYIKSEFRPTENITKVYNNINAIIDNATVDIPSVVIDGGRNESNLECSLKANKYYSFEVRFAIPKHFPRINLDIQWKLHNGYGRNIICFVIPASIY